MDFKKNLLLAALIVLGVVQVASALPFNDDMVDNPLKVGRLMRSRPEGSVPSGGSDFYVPSKEAATKLTNPIKGDAFSIKNGERLFAVNCQPCHGKIDAVPYEPGPVTKFLPGPNLADDLYREKPRDPKNGTGRSDGYIYATIHFGGMALMPPVGWKLSPQEHWDIVNYVRSIQER